MICKLNSALETDIGNWRTHWKNIAEYFNPDNDNVFGGQTTGEKKYQRLMDSYGVNALNRLTDFIHSSIFNPYVPMFYLTSTDDSVDNIQSVAQYLEEIRKAMHMIIFNSNIPIEAHTFILETLSNGTAFATFEEDEEAAIRMNSRPIYDCNFFEDAKGLPDGIIYKTKKTALELVEEYGADAVPENVNKCIAYEPTRKFEVLVYVNKTSRVPKEYQHPLMEYTSIHLLKEFSFVMKISGYHEKSFAIARYKKIAGERHGRSPCMAALPTMKTCDNMMRTWVQGAELAILPPLQAPDEGVLLPIKFTPAGMNYYRADSKDRVEPIYTGGDPRIGRDIIEYLHDKLKETFYLDQIHLVENDRMTTVEVDTRNDEARRVFAPFISRLETEFLSILIIKLLGIMSRNNLLPPMPPELAESGKVIEIRFSSSLKKAQQSIEAEAIARAYGTVSQMATVDSSVSDILDLDAHVKLIYRSLAAPTILLRNDNEVMGIRKARAQAAATRSAIEDSETEARAANQNAQADKASSQVGV